MVPSDDMLSQDEIDALLKQGKEDENTADRSGDDQPTLDELLSNTEQDAIGEIGNISFGSSSTALSTLLNQKVDITTPHLSLIRTEQLKDEFPRPYVSVHVKYLDGFQGLNLLIVEMEDARIIADLMLGGDGTSPKQELNDMHLSAVQEAMNQMMGSAATSMSTIFDQKVDISPPHVDIFDVQQGEQTHPLSEEDLLLKVSFHMKVGNLIDSQIMHLLPLPFAKEMVDKLLHASKTEEQPVSGSSLSDQRIQEQESVQNGENQQQEQMQQEKGQQKEERKAALEQHDQGKTQSFASATDRQSEPSAHGSGGHVQGGDARVQNVQFSSFTSDGTASGNNANLDLLMDIPLQVTVELGRTKKIIKDILDLSPGSIIELDKLAGEPVDILVNQKLIAKGEVVVIEENFGVRVTDIVSQQDRLLKFQ